MKKLFVKVTGPGATGGPFGPEDIWEIEKVTDVQDAAEGELAIVTKAIPDHPRRAFRRPQYVIYPGGAWTRVVLYEIEKEDES